MAQTNITLSSKVIAITGANRGIGLGIAESCLVNDAARVYSLDIGDTTDELHGLSQRFPGKLFAIHTDVTQESSVAAAVDKVIDEAGALHGTVVNAGRTKHKPALEFTDKEIEALFSVNLFGSFYTARTAARAFIRLGIKGSIVFTASMTSTDQTSASPPLPTAPPKPASGT